MNKPSHLQAISKGIEKAGKDREKARKAFNEQLGEPDLFVGDEEDPRFGIGYWKLANGGGVVTYRRYANGYDPNSRVEYSKELLNKVAK